MRSSRGPHARKPFRLLALGSAALVDAGGAVVAEQRRRLAVLVLIAAGRGNGVSRDKLVSYLSPESSAESARHALHQLLYYLRQQACEDVLLGTEALRFNPDVLTSDVQEFEEALDRGDLGSAVVLYRGAFLDGFHIGDSAEFEEWAAGERSRLAARHIDALFRLAAAADGRNDHSAAIGWWTRLSGLDPLGGRAASGLIRAYAAAGDIPTALRHAATYESIVRTEFGAEPDPEFAAWVAELQTRGRTPASERRELLPDDVAVATDASLPTKRKGVRLALAAAAVMVIGAVAAWSTTGGRFGLWPPEPPAHDSLRLRIVTALLPFDPADATLARRVRDGAIAEMEKDPWLFVKTPEAWVQQAPLIGLGETALMEPDTVRKYARKTRTHAIVDFGVSRAANGFVISAEARAASSDSSLGVIAEAAASAVDLPDAMTRLGRRLRERLVAARSTLPPTKWSANTTDQPAQAIELYVEGRSEASRRNFIEAARRAKEAVAVDSTFAQAWRLVHTSLYNAQLSVDDQLHAISAAFRFRDRVRAPYWRLDIVTAYYRAIGDPERALVFYDTIARLAPVQNVNAGLAYGTLRRYDLATRGYRRYVDASPRGSITDAHPNLVGSLLDQGKVAEAKGVVAEMVRADSMHPNTFQSRALVFTAVRGWDSLGALGTTRLGSARTPMDSTVGIRWVRNAAIVRGQFAAFDSMARLANTIVPARGSSGDYLAAELQRAQLRATVAGDTVRARAIADSGLAIARWASLKPMDRPYLAMLLYLASVGDIERGTDMAREWSRITPVEFKRRDSLNVLVGLGELALASGNAREALRLFRIADVRDCQPCFYPRFARAFDALNERDSARVWFERYASAVSPANSRGDAVELGHTYRRLGELYEERGDVRAALKWFEQLTTLWATSDTRAIQASVTAVRDRVNALRRQGVL